MVLLPACIVSQKMASTLEGKRMVDTKKVGREGGRDQTVLRSFNRFVCERVLLLLLLRVVLKALKLRRAIDTSK